MRPWVIVAGDFVRTGGMDRANHALAAHLAESGREVHLVAHRVEAALSSEPAVTWHRVRRPLGSHLLGFPLLDRAGRAVARALAGRRPVVLANGGNCRAAAASWLHYVHAAHRPAFPGRPLRRVMAGAGRRMALRDERRVAKEARLLVANSQRTRDDAVHRLGASPERVRVCYYGADAERFRPPSAAERRAARAALGWEATRPVVTFVGALGDRRKGFDTLFAAWRTLCADRSWDATLAVVGTGSEAAAWRHRAEAAGLGDRVRFLGFRSDVREVLWASDAVAAPARYEAYGLAVHEAVCCAVPAIVSAEAGVAERISGGLRELLVAVPDDAAEVAARLRAWHTERGHYADLAAAASRTLRGRAWADMAEELAGWVEETLP